MTTAKAILTPLAIIIASAMLCLTFRFEVMDRSSGLFLFDRFRGTMTVCGSQNQQAQLTCRTFNRVEWNKQTP